MSRMQKSGGIAALGEALIYIIMFVFYGAYFSYPSNSTVEEKLIYLSQNQLPLSLMNFIGYILFGILLVVVVQSLHARLKVHSQTLTQTASIFGLIWVGIIIAAGMVANIGLQTVIGLSVTEPEQARAVWLSVSVVQESLGGGIEIVGAIWMILISIIAIKAKCLPHGLNYIGAIVGLVGVFTIYPADVFKEIFGVGQIVWFSWLGICLLRTESEGKQH
ncbi:DUF4386 family protein [Aliiglaciecola sp. 3_MG-2023]|uniref:DUF4386 family protein n=1 Tax=Aliiglaciecola sp. 3_MG-2023 TaxID=3062644 RepID=UPI0026E1423D|nr:DUF4386 family protein [Aliiglaciecola sp. 3_MG-2023]MDO6695205.1 DUF4386 family protein [Aliiglaciecola sp. 3_MG-2023]